MKAPIETVILRILERHPRVRLAVLFGSLASGHARKESDLDLAVDTGEPLTAEEKMALVEDLAREIGRYKVRIERPRLAGKPSDDVTPRRYVGKSAVKETTIAGNAITAMLSLPDAAKLVR